MNTSTPMIFVAIIDNIIGINVQKGRWIKANQPAEFIQAEIDQLLAENGITDPTDWIIRDSNFGLNICPPRYKFDLKAVAKAAGFVSLA